MTKSKRNRVTLDKSDEPPVKLRRGRRERMELLAKAASKGLLDMPGELLEHIIAHVNIWHHDHIRATSRRFRDIENTYLMHEFTSALKLFTAQDPHGHEYAALKVIHQATEVYVHSGYGSVFCGCMLPMLRSCYRKPFNPAMMHISKFLVNFYNRADQLIGDLCSQRSRLLYSLTLMRFFKKFDRSTIISSAAMPLHWRIVVELKGPWLGTLWSSKARTSGQQPVKRSNLLVILSEMLMASIRGKSFKRVWECGSDIFVFGYDMRKGKRVPRTLFSFTVHGSKKICSLFRSCLEDDGEKFVWPTKWPRDQFTVNLHITCKEAMKWGCSKSQHMEFGPFREPTYMDDDENYDNTEFGPSIEPTCSDDDDNVISREFGFFREPMRSNVSVNVTNITFVPFREPISSDVNLNSTNITFVPFRELPICSNNDVNVTNTAFGHFREPICSNNDVNVTNTAFGHFREPICIDDDDDVIIGKSNSNISVIVLD